MNLVFGILGILALLAGVWYIRKKVAG